MHPLPFLRSIPFVTIIFLIFMVQVFNMSMDPPDFHPGKEDLSMSEIASCSELVLEINLEKEHALNEIDGSADIVHTRSIFLFFFTFKSIHFIKKNLASEQRFPVPFW